MSAFALITGRSRLFTSAALTKKFTPTGMTKKTFTPTTSLGLVSRQSAIFEVSLLMCVSHYKHIGLCLMRNVFQTFRPLLITIVMGNLLKIGAFLLQFPIGFYAIFFFEAFYGIMQLAISFVFVCFFHNGMMLQQSRFLTKHWIRMMNNKLQNLGKVGI